MIPPHVAVVSARPHLVAEVSRLCAMAGQPVRVAASAPEIARACRAAVLTVVDDCSVDAVGEVVGSCNSDVVVVTDDVGRVASWQAAVRLGARCVVTLPEGAAELLDLLAMAGERSGPVGPLIGVLGGRGGAGASTFAIAVSWAVAQRAVPVTLVDLDPVGGGIDVALGLENAAGLRWPDLRDAHGVIASSALREQLPSVGALAVVSASSRRGGDDSPAQLPSRRAVASVIDAGRRGGGAAVVDLPRHPSDVVDATVAACTVLLLVVAADVRAVSAATSVLRRVQPMCDDIRVVVRVEPRSRLREHDVVAALGLPHAATVRAEPAVTAAIDRAQLLSWLRRSRLARAAHRTVDEIVPAALGNL